MFWVFFAQNTQKGNQALKTLLFNVHSTHNFHIKTYCLLSSFPSHRAKIEGQGEQDHGGKVSKTNICELEEEVRAGSLRSMRKDFTVVV